MQAARVLILNGALKGEEGICLSKGMNGRSAVSPDCSGEILSLMANTEFKIQGATKRDPFLRISS